MGTAKAAVFSCKEGKTEQTPSPADQLKLVTKCTKTGLATAKACTDLDAACVATEIKAVKKKDKTDAKCVAKTCADYVKDKATCDKGPSCVFTAGDKVTPGTFKCTPDA